MCHLLSDALGKFKQGAKPRHSPVDDVGGACPFLLGEKDGHACPVGGGHLGHLDGLGPVSNILVLGSE